MKQIITLGGGGFLSGTERALDSYILDQAVVSSPNIGYMGTASGDDARFVVRFFSRFSKLDCKPSALSLFGRVQDLEKWVMEQDVIFVGGGNTKSMLGVWSSWGLPALLQDALENGTVLSGVSAGAICWFESGITDSVASSYSALDGLGFLQGSCCPHYSSEPGRKPVYEQLVMSNQIVPGIAIDDGVAVHWVDANPKKIVSAKAGASAYRVHSEAQGIVTTKIDSAELVVLS